MSRRSIHQRGDSETRALRKAQRKSAAIIRKAMKEATKVYLEALQRYRPPPQTHTPIGTAEQYEKCVICGEGDLLAKLQTGEVAFKENRDGDIKFAIDGKDIEDEDVTLDLRSHLWEIRNCKENKMEFFDGSKRRMCKNGHHWCCCPIHMVRVAQQGGNGLTKDESWCECEALDGNPVDPYHERTYSLAARYCE
jgi:hypothetical protein